MTKSDLLGCAACTVAGSVPFISHIVFAPKKTAHGTSLFFLVCALWEFGVPLVLSAFLVNVVLTLFSNYMCLSGRVWNAVDNEFSPRIYIIVIISPQQSKATDTVPSTHRVKIHFIHPLFYCI